MLGSLQGFSQGGSGQSGPPQQQQQQQPGPGAGMGGGMGGIPPPPPLNGQDFTLSSVLHFLQTEWRRYERDRNEWEIERAEMRARIALLEGERRSFDNVRVDLMRRIKMLEYALRMERTKQLPGPATAQSVPPSKLAAIQAQSGSAGPGSSVGAGAGGSHKDGDAGSHKDGSGGSSPRSEDSPLPSENRHSISGIPNGAPSTTGVNGRSGTWDMNRVSGNFNSGQFPGLGKALANRDPKSRAKSRDYLKQCLQEVSYLTSPAAMNPLPNRPLVQNSTLPLSLPNLPSFEQMPYNGRPRKVMPEVSGKDFPGLGGLMSGPPSAPASTGGQGGPLLERSSQSNTMAMALGQTQSSTAPSSVGTTQSQGQNIVPIISTEQTGQNDGNDGNLPTAIFRPDNAGEWRERLRLANEASEKARLGAQGSEGGAAWSRDDEEGKFDVDEEEDEVSEGGTEQKMWKTRRTLRNHLDAVRAVAFHPSEMCLATGGDDNTVKIWRMDVASLTSTSARPTTEVEPQLTLRGHSAAITRLVHSPTKGLLYSASLDSSIRIWALPANNANTYGAYDPTRARGELIGHTDAVWDLTLARDENTLVSCGAEGAVKVWDVSGPSGGGALALTWGFVGLDADDPVDPRSEGEDGAPGCTAIEAIKTDIRKVAVAYSSAVIKIFEIDTGRETARITSEGDEGSAATQINRMASHPTMPLLVTGHEDKHIRIFDITTGQCTHSMLAHLDGVTSLAIDAAGFSLVSGSHDCSIRLWDLLGSRACLQEVPAHREKAQEGVLDVAFHPSLPFMASAGADGVVKLFTSS